MQHHSSSDERVGRRQGCRLCASSKRDRGQRLRHTGGGARTNACWAFQMLILQGISKTLAQISQCMEQLGVPHTQMGVAPMPGEGGCRCPAAEDERVGHNVTQGTRGAKQWKSKKAACAKGSSESSSSSDEDSAHRDKRYWKAGAMIPGLPS